MACTGKKASVRNEMPIKEKEMTICKFCKRLCDGAGPYCEACEKEAKIDDFGEIDYYDDLDEDRDE